MECFEEGHQRKDENKHGEGNELVEGKLTLLYETNWVIKGSGGGDKTLKVLLGRIDGEGRSKG